MTAPVLKRTKIVLPSTAHMFVVLRSSAISDVKPPAADQSSASKADGVAVQALPTTITTIGTARRPSSFEAIKSDGVQLAKPKN